MKRYALFAWHPFEAAGGWNDFVDSFDSVQDAKEKAAADAYHSIWQVVDVNDGTVVAAA